MVGFTNYSADNTLDYHTGEASMPATPTVYIALFTAVGTDAGTGFTEVTGGSYARVTTSAGNWNAASGTSPSTISNSATLTFATATASWGTVIAVGGYDALTSGNLLWWDYLGNYSWNPFTCTNASPGVLTAPAHGYSNGDSVVVTAEYGGTLPTTGGSWSGLLTVGGVTTDTFTAGVNTTSTGSGQVRKVLSQAVSSGVQVSFAGGSPGNLVITLA